MRERFGAQRGYRVTESGAPCSTSMRTASSLGLVDEGSPCICLLFLAACCADVARDFLDLAGMAPT